MRRAARQRPADRPTGARKALRRRLRRASCRPLPMLGLGLGLLSTGAAAADETAPPEPPPEAAPPEDTQTHQPWVPGPPATDPDFDPWAPPLDPANAPPPPPPPVMPMGQASLDPGYSTQARCRAAWQGDRKLIQRAVPTWAHPTVEGCVYDGNLDRWSIHEQTASFVLSAGIDLPLLAATAGLGTWAALTDPVARGREHWDPLSQSQRAGAGAGAQRRDPLPTRTQPDAGARTVSDVMLGGAFVGVLASPLALPKTSGRLTNAAMMTEVLGLNIAVQQLVARRVAEPRPFAFQDMSTWADDDFASTASDLSSPQTWTSYYSGHTSTVASVAYGYATIYSLDALDRSRSTTGLALLLYPVAFMVSNLEGQLRVDALAHDPTDVWVGHLAGGAIGIGVPLLHHVMARNGRARPGAPGPAPTGPRLQVSPALGTDTMGHGTIGVQGSW